MSYMNSGMDFLLNLSTTKLLFERSFGWGVKHFLPDRWVIRAPTNKQPIKSSILVFGVKPKKM